MNKDGTPSQISAQLHRNLLSLSPPMTRLNNNTQTCFEGIGQFPGLPYHINIDPMVPPKQTPCRPVPIHLKSAFQEEINQMLHAGVLILVNKATPWINSFVLMEKRTNHGPSKIKNLSRSN